MRPELISLLHGARYDLQCETDPQRQAQAKARLDSLLAQCADQFHTTTELLRDVLQDDYRKWQQDEGLKPRRC
jgi:uncharacterized membrane-anchored protein YhcB (DUF1043 family)